MGKILLVRHQPSNTLQVKDCPEDTLDLRVDQVVGKIDIPDGWDSIDLLNALAEAFRQGYKCARPYYHIFRPDSTDLQNALAEAFRQGANWTIFRPNEPIDH